METGNLKANILDEKSVKRTLVRISHEIVEKKQRSREYSFSWYKKKRVSFSSKDCRKYKENRRC